MKQLLYVCEADSGGIMEYAIRQTAALLRAGVEVVFLCKPSFPKERLGEGIRMEEFGGCREARVESRVSKKQPSGVLGKIGRMVKMISDLRSDAKQVAELAEELAKDSSTRQLLPVTRHNLGAAEVCVLFACYKEYFAPFWVWPLRRLAKKGIVIGTIAHDPVRDFVVGPVWWHRWSVRLAYSFVRHVFVHDDTPVDFGGKPPERIEVHQIPHGPYEVAQPKIGRVEMRWRLGFDAGLFKDFSHGDTANTEQGGAENKENAAKLKSETLKKNPATAEAPDSRPSTLDCKAPATSYSLPATPASPDIVFLAFGQIRDGKNLDLFLRAMTQLPKNVKLLVAGKGDSGSSRPEEFYQKLAEELGVGGRCRWNIRRIPDEEVGDIFAACDVVLVTYSAKFRSASGVLNAAVSARKPVLASSGAGPLKTVVEKYQLGIFVEPDDQEEILKGARQLATRHQLHATSTPAWSHYEKENSWEGNAKKVVEGFET